MRSILVPLGLADERAYRLALKHVYSDDTFLVSFPKSGNTWLRFLLAYALSSKEKINMRNIDEIIPDIYSAGKLADHISRPRYLKSHDPFFAYYPKCVYLVRDYRDVLVSYYYYHVALGEYKGDFTTYAESIDNLHPFGKWTDHVSGALRFAQENPGRVLVVRYEDLVNETENTLEKILVFCSITPAMPMKEIIARSSFYELRNNEMEEGSAFRDISQKNFFREGKIGGWKTVMTEEQSQKLVSANTFINRQLGYQ